MPRENVLLPQNDDGYARGNVRHARDYVPRSHVQKDSSCRDRGFRVLNPKSR